jgi:hypothetical protein
VVARLASRDGEPDGGAGRGVVRPDGLGPSRWPHSRRSARIAPCSIHYPHDGAWCWSGSLSRSGS